ncbi:MAG TPA: pitrilysin family protein [Polyangia bacterium]
MLFSRHKDVLPNGLTVVTVELPHLHSVSVVMYARVGSRYETVEDNGLSHFLEHMLFRGTMRLPDAYALNHSIEALGGTLYAETGRDYSLYQISLHPETLQPGLELFGEIFAQPAFADVHVERRIVLEEMHEDHDEDGRLVNIDDLARLAVWPDHPLGYRITGPYENVERFDDADVRRHFASHYGARNMVLTVSGNVKRDDVIGTLHRAFGPLAEGRALEVAAPPETQDAPRFLYVPREGSQTNVQILFRAFPETDPDFPALIALGRIVDDGMSTRLHTRVVDELGLAYYCSASLEPFVDAGLYEIDGACVHGHVPALVREGIAVLTRLRDTPPLQEELDKAQRRYRWDLEASFDDPDAMAGWWGGTELFFGPLTVEAKVERVKKVTPEAVQRVAQRLLRPERLTVACVGMLTKKLEREVRGIVEKFK